MLFNYIFKLYAKHLFFILLALVSFFVFFDFILNVKKLPDASNLQMLYVSFKTMEALDVLWQLSLVFAFITSWIALVKSNALVSFYALGYKKRAVAAPFIAIFFIAYLSMIALQTTDFSYAKDKAKQIRSNGALGSVTKDIFFKYDDNYVYMKQLFPLQKKANGIRIFQTLQDFEVKIIHANEAFFEGDAWRLPNVTISYVEDFKVTSQEFENYITLEGFKPKVLESVYEEGTGFTIIDAVDAAKLFFTQGIKTDRIQAVLMQKIFTPFFALILILIFIQKLPVHARFSNLTVTTTFYITLTLIFWGALFALYRISLTGVVAPQTGIVLPLVVMIFIMLTLYYLSRKRQLATKP
jgi:lipopolysaccharide export system permease protein